MHKKANRAWTAAENNRILTLREKGWTIAQIADDLGGSYDTVYRKVRFGKIRASANKKKRACMCCGAVFVSSGNGNRLCSYCRLKDSIIVSQAAG